MSVQKLNLTNVLKEPTQRAKPTLATILRERKVVDSRDAIERQELESLMCGGLSPENYKYWMDKRREEEMRRSEGKVEERKLAAKEANQRLHQIGRQKLEEKRIAAQRLREEEMKLKEELACRNDEQMDCARDRVDKVMLAHMNSNIAVFKDKQKKKIDARQVQEKSVMLLEKVKKIKAKEEAVVKDRIQKLKAASIVSQRIRQFYNPSEIKNYDRPCDMSDAEAKLRIEIQKSENKAQIAERRNRVEAEKNSKKERLEEAIQTISAYHDLLKERSKYKI